VKFLDVTQLQGETNGNLIEQYQAFTGRWAGLKEKITDVAATSAMVPAVSTGKGPVKTPVARGGKKDSRAASEIAATQSSHVDSVLAEWHARLNAGFWGGLQKEFTAAGIAVAPFNDGPSFSSSVRQEVASLAASKQDRNHRRDALEAEDRQGLARRTDRRMHAREDGIRRPGQARERALQGDD